MDDSISQTLMPQATKFDDRLSVIKAKDKDVAWYPYRSMADVQHLCKILPAEIIESLATAKLN